MNIIASTDFEFIEQIQDSFSKHFDTKAIIHQLTSDLSNYAYSHQEAYTLCLNKLLFAKESVKHVKIYDYIVCIEGVIFPICTYTKFIVLESICVLVENCKTSEIKFDFSVTQEYPLEKVYNLFKADYKPEDIIMFINDFYSQKKLFYTRKDKIRQTIDQVLSEFNLVTPS